MQVHLQHRRLHGQHPPGQAAGHWSGGEGGAGARSLRSFTGAAGLPRVAGSCTGCQPRAYCSLFHRRASCHAGPSVLWLGHCRAAPSQPCPRPAGPRSRRRSLNKTANSLVKTTACLVATASRLPLLVLDRAGATDGRHRKTLPLPPSCLASRVPWLSHSGCSAGGGGYPGSIHAQAHAWLCWAVPPLPGPPRPAPPPPRPTLQSFIIQRCNPLSTTSPAGATV